MAVALDWHDREVLAFSAAPRSLAGTELWDAAGVRALLPTCIEDYNTRGPHSALGMRSPAEYRAQLQVSDSSVQ